MVTGGFLGFFTFKFDIAFAYTPHNPININSDGDFTADNGVTGGSGTPQDPYIIEGWEIGAHLVMCISISDTNAHFIIRDVNVYHSGSSGVSSGHDYGIYLKNVANARVENSTASSEYGGIRLDSSDNVTVTDNNVQNNLWGLYLLSSTKVTITGNVFLSNGISMNGDIISHYNSHVIAQDNLVNGMPIQYHKNCVDVDIDGLSIGQLIMANCTDVRVSNLQINNTDIGIEMGFVENALITNNTVSNSMYGIRLSSSYNLKITSNTFSSNNDRDIYIGSSSNATVTGNTLKSNNWMSFTLFSSANMNIKGNDISHNQYGFAIDSSTNCTITDNTVSYNEYGIRLWFSTNIQVYHNDFIDNLEQGYDNGGNENSWDNGYPEGGNFWSEYTGVDEKSGLNQDQSGGDGIGDTSYTIDDDSRDNYPLIKPYVVPTAPQNLQAISGDGQVMLMWTAPDSEGSNPIINYSIYRGTYPGTETFLVQIGNELNYTDTGLYNAQTYYYRVSAANPYGEGLLSYEVTATPATVPTSPTDLAATAGDSYVYVTWYIPAWDGGSPITNYTVYRGTTLINITFFAEVGNVLYYTDTAVINGVPYYYKVRAVNGVGEGLLSDEVNATPVTVPSAPTDLKATSGDSYINLTWSAPHLDGGSSIITYTIYRGYISNQVTPLTEIGNVSYYNDTSVTNGATYYYKVSAKNAVGESQLSFEASGTPKAQPITPRGSSKELPVWLWIALPIVIVVIVIGFIVGFAIHRKRKNQQPPQDSPPS